jgi:hypothetical protein
MAGMISLTALAKEGRQETDLHSTVEGSSSVLPGLLRKTSDT